MDPITEMAAQLDALRARHQVQQLALDAALRLLTPQQTHDCAEALRDGVTRLWASKGEALREREDEALASEFAALLQRLVPMVPRLPLRRRRHQPA